MRIERRSKNLDQNKACGRKDTLAGEYQPVDRAFWRTHAGIISRASTLIAQGNAGEASRSCVCLAAAPDEGKVSQTGPAFAPWSTVGPQCAHTRRGGTSRRTRTLSFVSVWRGG